MVKGLLQKLNQEKNVNIISTSLQINGARPTTATTVYTATHDKQGYQVTIDGIGFMCKEEIYIIHSVFGALMAEKWGAAMASEAPSKRDIKDLLFQTRKDNISPAPHPDAP